MKIAISIAEPELDAAFEPRFGRAAAFLIIDSPNGDQNILVNSAAQLGSGAGIRAADLLIRQGVEAAISGAFGPKAHDVLHAANVKMYQVSAGTVNEITTKFLNGDLTPMGEN